MTEDGWKAVVDELKGKVSIGNLHGPSVDNFIQEIEDKYKLTGILPDLVSWFTCRLLDVATTTMYNFIPLAYYSSGKKGVPDEDDMIQEVYDVRNIAFKSDNHRYYIHKQR